MIRRLLACSIALLGVAGTAATHAADNYPTRPVRMIVPFAPGGASDFVARIIQPRMSELLGQQVIIDNRAGAAGNIGVEVAANATADGYNSLLGNVGTMAINPNIFTKFPVKPARDLIAVTQVVDVPGALVVHPSIPAKSAKEFVAHLKANAGKLNYGSPGPGSANRIEMENFLLTTGTRMVHVPYKGGAGPAMIGLLGNEVQAMFVTFSSAITFAKQGRIRMLGVTAPQRVAAMPDVPTMSEQGFKEMTTGSWQGMFLPKNTPRAIVNKIFSVTTQTMKHPEVVKRLQDGGVDIVVSQSPEDFSKFVKNENARFAKVIKDAKIETE
jgi:tripartite-type tricarboxylate transporter receptor subunit TctC